MFRRSSRVLRRSVSAFLQEPGQAKSFDATLAACRAENRDMASMLSSDFLLLQSKLFKYRIARLGQETRYVLRHPLGCFPPAPVLLGHVVALSVTFYAALCFGRHSSRSLVAPPLIKTEADLRAELEAVQAADAAAAAKVKAKRAADEAAGTTAA